MKLSKNKEMKCTSLKAHNIETVSRNFYKR